MNTRRLNSEHRAVEAEPSRPLRFRFFSSLMCIVLSLFAAAPGWALPLPALGAAMDPMAAHLLGGLSSTTLGEGAGGSGDATAFALSFHADELASTPFPSDLFTVRARQNLSGRQVQLPLPDCTQRPTDCFLIGQLNELDGFNVQPRLSLPFTGDLDLDTLGNHSVFLLRLWDTAPHGGRQTKRAPRKVGVDQLVWDPATRTLHFESGRLLEQHTRYALVVTRALRDLEGRRLATTPFREFLWSLLRDGQHRAYARDLVWGLWAAAWSGVPAKEVAGISVFTTQSITSMLEKVREQIDQQEPPAIDFALAPALALEPRIDLADIEDIVVRRQVLVDTDAPGAFQSSSLPEELLDPTAVQALVFGRFDSPIYRRPQDLQIPALATRSGEPAALGHESVLFSLMLPAGQQPDGGWPVVIYGHGDGPGLTSDPFLVANEVLRRGLALITINAVGYGGGHSSTLHIQRRDLPAVELSAGGRGFDVDGDGVIVAGSLGVSEGYGGGAFNLPRDGRRQTVVDLMQLRRVIEAGMDLDADGAIDLDPTRISYYGASLGGYHGPLLAAVDPAVRSAVFYAGGGSSLDLRWVPEIRPDFELAMASFQPPLTNVGDVQQCLSGGPCDLRFDEDLPLRGRPPVSDPRPGALAIQEALERLEWLSQTGNPAAYAAHLRSKPLPGVEPKDVLLQLSRGDLQVPNPGSSAVVRAGNLVHRTTMYRHDLVFGSPDFPEVTEPDGHLLIFFDLLPEAPDRFAVASRTQAAEFLASGGGLLLDPDGSEPYFELPIALPLPEDCGYLIDDPRITGCR